MAIEVSSAFCFICNSSDTGVSHCTKHFRLWWEEGAVFVKHGSGDAIGGDRKRKVSDDWLEFLAPPLLVDSTTRASEQKSKRSRLVTSAYARLYKRLWMSEAKQQNLERVLRSFGVNCDGDLAALSDESFAQLSQKLGGSGGLFAGRAKKLRDSLRVDAGAKN